MRLGEALVLERIEVRHVAEVVLAQRIEYIRPMGIHRGQRRPGMHHLVQS